MSNVSFQIEDFTAEAAANPYTEAVAALAQAGEGKALSITVPRGTKRLTDEEKAAGAEPQPGNGGKDRLLFQQAANAAGHTARVRKEEVTEDGQIKLTFTLTAKHARAGSKRGETPAEENVETPTEESAEEQHEGDESHEERAGRRRRG